MVAKATGSHVVDYVVQDLDPVAWETYWVHACAPNLERRNGEVIVAYLLEGGYSRFLSVFFSLSLTLSLILSLSGKRTCLWQVMKRKSNYYY